MKKTLDWSPLDSIMASPKVFDKMPESEASVYIDDYL